MNNIFLMLLFSIGLLFISCSKNNPDPTCEEGGVEVNP